jgi:hypothetical protein
MTAYPATMTAPKTRTTKDPKEKARVLQGRLLKGLDLILEAQAAGDQVKAASLQALYDRMEVEYQEAKKTYSQTPEDLLRCPDCPHLGEGSLYELAGVWVICDSPCKKDGQE